MTDEAQAVEAAPAAEQTESTAAGTSKTRHKYLSAAFNAAVGFGLTYAAKALIVTALTSTAAAALIPVVAVVATATISTLLCHEGKRWRSKKDADDTARYFSAQNAKDIFNKENLKGVFSRQNAKTFAVSAVFAGIGSVIAYGLHEGWFQSSLEKLFGATPAPAAPLPHHVAPTPVAPHVAPVAPVAPHIVAPVAPVAAPCVSPVEHFTQAIHGHHVSAQVQDALHRAASHNAHVAAQGVKDLAYFANNGLGGVAKNHQLALELFQKAADAGNVQAKVDMLYMQFHGVSGVHANAQAAVDAMQQIHTPRASAFVHEWAKLGHVPKHVTGFDSKAILQGVKLSCAH